MADRAALVGRQTDALLQNLHALRNRCRRADKMRERFRARLEARLYVRRTHRRQLEKLFAHPVQIKSTVCPVRSRHPREVHAVESEEQMSSVGQFRKRRP